MLKTVVLFHCQILYIMWIVENIKEKLLNQKTRNVQCMQAYLPSHMASRKTNSYNSRIQWNALSICFHSKVEYYFESTK